MWSRIQIVYAMLSMQWANFKWSSAAIVIFIELLLLLQYFILHITGECKNILALF